ncbi:hypothetical protein [Rothia amarae]|uniref:hypothetical protein n=1 Tax=Rothia amarae TaxID=169480 RepID=UPI00092C0B29|nr:Region found in RelA / SpoT proteins [Mycobacteroides abscessus subsp. abscessus]
MSTSNFLSHRPEWTNGDINRIGDSLRADNQLSEDQDSLWGDFLVHSEKFIEELNLILENIISSFIEGEKSRGCSDISVEISTRVKTEISIKEKLRRQRTKLSRIQDIAGLRCQINCNLTQLEELSRTSEEVLDEPGVTVVRKNLLNGEHAGYRAIHLHITYPAGRAELQFRTESQSRWANIYELLADKIGRSIRYHEGVESSHPQAEILNQSLEISKKVFSLEQQSTSLQQKIYNSPQSCELNMLYNKLEEINRKKVLCLDEFEQAVALLESLEKERSK